ncbi:LysR family transcriptional regulator [Sporomusa aerivorans]|uniref:LysR family transcriptional regulator n=1 Tax=Sporomusa aerivorans TaxID=204936 RepID=UPI00352AF2F7
MEIIHLKYFLEVARHKSFSKAATASHVSQSVISKLIKDLELEFGVVLFDRTSKHVALTEAGAIFLTDADQVVTLFNNLSSKFDSNCKIPRGKVSIGIPLMAEAITFAQLLGDFREKYPKVATELYESGSKKIEVAVQDGMLDIGIICRLPGNPDIYDAFTFSHDPLQVVVHPQHALAEAQTLRLADLAQESFILSSSDFSLHDAIVKRCKQAGFIPKIVLETSQRELMIETVAVNLGIALIPKNVCDGLNHKLVRAIPLADPEIIHSMSLIWKHGRILSHPARLFLDFAGEYLLGNPQENTKS